MEGAREFLHIFIELCHLLHFPPSSSFSFVSPVRESRFFTVANLPTAFGLPLVKDIVKVIRVAVLMSVPGVGELSSASAEQSLAGTVRVHLEFWNLICAFSLYCMFNLKLFQDKSFTKDGSTETVCDTYLSQTVPQKPSVIRIYHRRFITGTVCDNSQTVSITNRL
uniref:PH01B001E05.17 protein n=1 Tax=Phyllostachys edulis TaxID=38705 RepID=L0P1V9_PHYED|nr:PH01B001E05.17 [Phyllostachys edulis]